VKEIALDPIPNQSLSVQLDNRLYDITIKETHGVMAATIVRDGVTVVSGMRIAPGEPILPYRYQESGNFIILTANDDYPYYTQFGITQNFLYLSPAELEVLRGT
jgi:hypothetical protein